MSGVIDKVIRKIERRLRRPVKKNENLVRWGVIGLGYMAECLSEAIDENRQGILAAVASRSIDKAKAFAVKHGNCKAYGSYESMISDSVLNLDIIYIATPTKHHYENIKLCLLAGKNVMCEKPITSNVQEIEELRKLAQEKGCFLMEGMWMKCLPTYQKALAWIKEGRVGTVDLIKADIYKREKIERSRSIFDKEQGGGVLRDYGVYAVAFPTGFTDGMPDELNGYSRMSNFGIDSDWTIHMQFKNIQVFLNISSDYQSLSKAAIIGSKGTIEWDSQFNRTNCITLYDVEGKLLEKFTFEYRFDGFEYEVNEVHQSIRNGFKESVLVPLESSIVTQKIIGQLIDGKQ